MKLHLSLLIATLGACVADEPLTIEQTAELGDCIKPVLIQPGVDQLLLAVTDDNYAVYQEGQALFATKLKRNAERLSIGEVPGTNIAQVLQVGKVVFIWTNPQRTVPGFGVSPLVLWTAKHGAQLISAQSSVGLVATAASSDSSQIVFTTNVTDDNARGDLVHALTKDALHPTTLLANTAMAFPNGLCRPLANFGTDRGREFPVAVYCAGTDTTATLSKWDGGIRTDLISNILTPLPFILESNAAASTFLMSLANNSVATVTTRGEITVVDPAARSPLGFVGVDDSVAYVALGAPAQLRFARRGEAPQVVSGIAGVYRGTYNRSGYSKPRGLSSDGELALFATFRTATGSDMNLLDMRTGAKIPLETNPIGSTFSEVFTSDASHALFVTGFDPSTGLGTLVAGDRTGVTHQVGPTGGVWDVLAASDSDVSFNTNPNGDFSTLRSFLLSTGDLFVADTEHPGAAPRAIASQAALFYLPSHEREKLVFPSASEPAGPGLYLAPARP